MEKEEFMSRGCCRKVDFPLFSQVRAGLDHLGQIQHRFRNPWNEGPEASGLRFSLEKPVHLHCFVFHCHRNGIQVQSL